MKLRGSVLSFSLALLLVCLPSYAQAAKPSNFAGTWNFALVGTKDACGLGLVGRKVNLSTVITQKGNKASLTLQGVKLKATVTGNKIKGSGSYSTSGLKISGTLSATLKGANKMTIPNTTLTIKSGSRSCKIALKGSGTR